MSYCIQSKLLCGLCFENDARYVSERGALVCGLCPIKHKEDSIRIEDVPKLIAWARQANKHVMRGLGMTSEEQAAAYPLDAECNLYLSSILGRKP